MPAETIGYSQLIDLIFNSNISISFVLNLCFLFCYRGLRGKVPNRSLRGNKIILFRETSSWVSRRCVMK